MPSDLTPSRTRRVAVDALSMRRVLVVGAVSATLLLAACGGSGGGTGTGDGSGTGSTVATTPVGNDNPVTGPIDRARDVANRQSQQQQQLDAQTGQADQPGG